MKFAYILIVFSLISCLEKTKEKKSPVVVESKVTTIQAPEVLVAVPLKKQDTTSFITVIKSIKEKHLPVIDTTGFDSFIDEDDVKYVDVKGLQLDKIYPEFNNEGFNIWAMNCYKVALSENFHSVVISIKIDNEEMKTILVNYDFEGNIIDFKVISYDEIAEGFSRFTSKINKYILTLNHIIWAEKQEIEKEFYKIELNGKIKLIDSTNINTQIETLTQENLVNKVIKELKIDESKTRFMVS